MLQEQQQWPAIANVGQTLRAWRAAKAALSPGAPAADSTPAQWRAGLQQQLYDASRLSLWHSSGIDFLRYWAAPETTVAGFGASQSLSLLRHIVFSHEDQAAHKLKLLVKHLRDQEGSVAVAGTAAALAAAEQQQQQPGHSRKSSAGGVALVCCEHLLAAGRATPDLHSLEPMLASSVDAQSVPLCRAVVYPPQLWAALVRQGHVHEAIALRLIAAGNQAFDWSGLQLSTRMAAMCDMRSMLWSALGTSQHTAEAASGASHVGLPRDLVLAIISEWCGHGCSPSWEWGLWGEPPHSTQTMRLLEQVM